MVRDLFEVLNIARTVVEEVGDYQRRNFRTSNFEAKQKTTAVDFVTTVDQNSEERLVSYLREKFPHDGFVCEESGLLNANNDWRWVIDPLDGTANYVSGIPIFAISVALQYQARTVLGIVFAPYLGEYYWAIKDQGAFRGQERLRIKGSHANSSHWILASGFPYNKLDQKCGSYLVRILPQIGAFRRMGAAAYDLCAVAYGALDGYWEHQLNLWDVAAGSLIVEEAGGLVKMDCNQNQVSIMCGDRKVVDFLGQMHRDQDEQAD